MRFPELAAKDPDSPLHRGGVAPRGAGRNV